MVSSWQYIYLSSGSRVWLVSRTILALLVLVQIHEKYTWTQFVTKALTFNSWSCSWTCWIRRLKGARVNNTLIGSFSACACKLSWTFSHAPEFSPYILPGRESSGTGLVHIPAHSRFVFTLVVSLDLSPCRMWMSGKLDLHNLSSVAKIADAAKIFFDIFLKKT